MVLSAINIGDKVRLEGLVAAAHRNGKMGQVTGYNTSTERFAVHLFTDTGGVVGVLTAKPQVVLAVKAANLVKDLLPNPGAAEKFKEGSDAEDSEGSWALPSFEDFTAAANARAKAANVCALVAKAWAFASVYAAAEAKAVLQEVSMLKVLKAPKLSPQQIVWEQEAAAMLVAVEAHAAAKAQAAVKAAAEGVNGGEKAKDLAEEKKNVATSTNLNNPLVFNNTAFAQKPPPATDLPLSQSGPAGVAALKFIAEPLLRPPDPGRAGSFAAPPWPPDPGGDGAFKSPLWPPDPGGVWASKSPSWPPDPGKVAERQLLGRGG